MRFTLVSARRKVLDLPAASSVSLPAQGGLMEVRPNHEPFVAAVAPGVLRVVAEDGAAHVFAVGAGMMETDGKTTTLFADTIDSAEDLSSVDLAAARAAAEEAVKKAREAGVSDPESLVDAEETLLREQARLMAAGR